MCSINRIYLLSDICHFVRPTEKAFLLRDGNILISKPLNPPIRKDDDQRNNNSSDMQL